MRRLLIAGNWKMNLSRAESVDLAKAIVASGDTSNIDIAVCPPYVYLDAVAQVVGSSSIGLGAQDMYHESKGAFTGEISAAMLCDIGCQYAILGHSERRHVIGETNELINKKVHAALAAGLIPILCVGETLEEREANTTKQVVQDQFDGSLAGVSTEQMMKVVIAYEPVWAIGTGKVATPEQAEEVHADLRSLLENRYNTEVAQTVRIQYGGSVKPDNAAELMAKENIDGALIGGASLKAEDFLAIGTAAQ